MPKCFGKILGPKRCGVETLSISLTNAIPGVSWDLKEMWRGDVCQTYSRRGNLGRLSISSIRTISGGVS
jgi:hypothetical protein